MTELQLALDFIDRERALAVAREAAPEVDILEAGTPLIKSVGISIVSDLKKAFPGKKVNADLKIMDVGAIEVEMAAKAGAHIVTVLGAAHDSTISEAVEAGKRFGAQVMADIINAPDPVKRAREVEALGVSFVCVHAGIDQQMRGIKPFEVLGKVAKAVSIPVAVAGGISAENAGECVALGASVVIVGGSITKAKDARAAAREVREALKKKIRARKSVSEDIRSLLLKVSSANVCDALQRKGAMTGLVSITPGAKAVGRAVTVRTFPGDWAKPVEAIDSAGEGDFIVVDEAGASIAVWGGLASLSCVKKRVAGALIDGAVRDVEEIRKLRFPVWAKSVSPGAGEPKGLGEAGIDIQCGGVRVRPGDWVVADESGAVVIPFEKALETALKAKDIAEKEERIAGEISKGGTLASVLKLKKWEKVR